MSTRKRIGDKGNGKTGEPAYAGTKLGMTEGPMQKCPTCGNTPLLDIVPRYIRSLSDSSANKRWITAEILGMNPDARSVEPLTGLLNDPDADVRKISAWALGQIKDTRAVGSLIAALNDENSEVRVEVVRVLEQIEFSTTDTTIRGKIGQAIIAYNDAKYK